MTRGITAHHDPDIAIRRDLLRLLLGEDGVVHVADCVRVAEEHTRRVHGYEPSPSVRGARDLLSATAAHVRASRRLPAPETEADGSPEVPQRAVRASLSAIDWISPKEAAAMLDCTERNVRDLCSRGSLESARRAGSRWVVDRVEIAARLATAPPRQGTR